MGVKELWGVVSGTGEVMAVNALSGQSVAVDLSCWVVDTQSLNIHHVTKPHLRNLLFRTLALLDAGIKPVFVLEGDAPDLKWDTIKSRNERNFSSASAKGVSKKTGKRSRFKSVLKECREVLELLGVPCIQAEGEAEATCAALSYHQVVDGVISQDSDVFLYGGTTVFRNFTASRKPTVEKFSMEIIENRQQVTREGMILLALLLGCDYLAEGVTGVGKDTALRFIQMLYRREINPLRWLKNWAADPRPLNGHTKLSSTKWKNGSDNDLENGIGVRLQATSGFPFTPILEEFQRCLSTPINKIKWRQPSFEKLVKWCITKLDWEPMYAVEKIFPAVTRWAVTTGVIIKTIQPIKMLKNCVRQGVPSCRVEWNVNCPTMPLKLPSTMTSDEPLGLLKSTLPHVILQFENTTKRGKKKKKAVKSITEAEDLSQQKFITDYIMEPVNDKLGDVDFSCSINRSSSLPVTSRRETENKMKLKGDNIEIDQKKLEDRIREIEFNEINMKSKGAKAEGSREKKKEDRKKKEIEEEKKKKDCNSRNKNFEFILGDTDLLKRAINRNKKKEEGSEYTVGNKINNYNFEYETNKNKVNKEKKYSKAATDFNIPPTEITKKYTVRNNDEMNDDYSFEYTLGGTSISDYNMSDVVGCETSDLVDNSDGNLSIIIDRIININIDSQGLDTGTCSFIKKEKEKKKRKEEEKEEEDCERHYSNLFERLRIGSQEDEKLEEAKEKKKKEEKEEKSAENSRVSKKMEAKGQSKPFCSIKNGGDRDSDARYSDGGYRTDQSISGCHNLARGGHGLNASMSLGKISNVNCSLNENINDSFNCINNSLNLNKNLNVSNSNSDVHSGHKSVSENDLEILIESDSETSRENKDRDKKSEDKDIYRKSKDMDKRREDRDRKSINRYSKIRFSLSLPDLSIFSDISTNDSDSVYLESNSVLFTDDSDSNTVLFTNCSDSNSVLYTNYSESNVVLSVNDFDSLYRDSNTVNQNTTPNKNSSIFNDFDSNTVLSTRDDSNTVVSTSDSDYIYLKSNTGNQITSPGTEKNNTLSKTKRIGREIGCIKELDSFNSNDIKIIHRERTSKSNQSTEVLNKIDTEEIGLEIRYIKEFDNFTSDKCIYKERTSKYTKNKSIGGVDIINNEELGSEIGYIETIDSCTSDKMIHRERISDRNSLTKVGAKSINLGEISNIITNMSLNTNTNEEKENLQQAEFVHGNFNKTEFKNSENICSVRPKYKTFTPETKFDKENLRKGELVHRKFNNTEFEDHYKKDTRNIHGARPKYKTFTPGTKFDKENLQSKTFEDKKDTRTINRNIRSKCESLPTDFSPISMSLSERLKLKYSDNAIIKLLDEM